MTKPKKKLSINVDTPIVDVTYNREENGSVDMLIDTPVIDAHYEKDEHGNKEWTIINNHKEYDFESNGKAPLMPKGTIWKIGGDMLKQFLKMGLGNLVKKKK